MITATYPASVVTPRGYHLLQLVSVLAFLGLFVSLMSAGDVAADGGAAAKLFLLLRMAFLVLLCTWFLRRDGETWADVGLRRPRRWWMVPLLVVGGFVLLLVVLSWVTQAVFPALGAQPPRTATAQAVQGNLAEYLFWVIPVAWGTAALGEELLMRGFILDRIAKVIGSSGTPALLCAIVLQSVFFASFHFHQGLGGVITTGVIGLVIGFVWLAGGRNLWACILLHGIINTISITEAYTAPL